MELSVERHPRGILVRVQGDIDTLTAPELQSCLNNSLNEGTELFVIDLEEVRYISSMGLRVFLSHLKRVKAGNGTMVMASPSKLVSEVFRMSGFSSYFDMVDSTEEAMARLQGS